MISAMDRIALCVLSFSLFLGLGAAPGLCHARLLDRVVASVDDRAITLTEFEETYRSMAEKSKGIPAEEVMDAMINRLLLLKEARKIKLEAPSEDELLREFIEVKIRAPVIIKDDEVRAYYEEHKSALGGRDFTSVRDEIEEYLFERETNRRLKVYLEELRRASDITIQLQR